MRHFRWSVYNGKAVCGSEQTAADHVHEGPEFRRFLFETHELICELCKTVYLRRGN